MAELVQMVLCPYCQNIYIKEDGDLVCSTCEPAYRADLALSEAATAIQSLGQASSAVINTRAGAIRALYQRFTKLMQQHSLLQEQS
jgi:uncharacterized Zn finger protein (UPF0148 family)